MLKNRLEKNLKRLKGFIKDQQLSCYRVYDKDIPEILDGSAEEVFGKSLISLFNESLISVLFMGSDKRETLKDQARKRFLED